VARHGPALPLPLCRRVPCFSPLLPGPRCTGRDSDGRRRVARSDADGAAPDRWLIVTRSQKITSAELRDMGVNEVLVDCAEYKYTHDITLRAD
jgi:hypothetical protein